MSLLRAHHKINAWTTVVVACEVSGVSKVIFSFVKSFMCFKTCMKSIRDDTPQAGAVITRPDEHAVNSQQNELAKQEKTRFFNEIKSKYSAKQVKSSYICIHSTALERVSMPVEDI